MCSKSSELLWFLFMFNPRYNFLCIFPDWHLKIWKQYNFCNWKGTKQLFSLHRWNIQVERRYFQLPLTADKVIAYRGDTGCYVLPSFILPESRAPGSNTNSLFALDDIKRSSTNPRQSNNTTSALNRGPAGSERKIWAQSEMKLVKWTWKVAEGRA